MCGIAAWISAPIEEWRIEKVVSLLGHRGPNGCGNRVRPIIKGRQAGLLHTRLSIIDLSDDAGQPMETACGQLAITFNGEIYNYLELRSELEAGGISFQTQSDTEVLLLAYKTWGASVLNRIVGMYAFSIIDRRQSIMFVARDPFGIKPLYFIRDGKGIWFASEIRALLALAHKTPMADLQTAHDYLALGQTDQTTRTFFDGVSVFPAANFAEISLEDKNCDLNPVRYWKAKIQGSDDQRDAYPPQRIRDQFFESVELHLRSDVPVGSCLSGGIDSSSIVCAMREVNPNTEIHTFSYIARDSSLSEERWVDAVNKRTGAVAHKINASNHDLIADLNPLIQAQGEPFGSTSIYAQYKVFEAAKNQGIKVMLDGQGADELFAGYPSFRGALIASHIKRGKLMDAFKLLVAGSGHHGQDRSVLMKVALHFLISSGLYSKARHIAGRGNRFPWIDLDVLNTRGVDTVISKPQQYSREILKEALRYSLEKSSVPQLLRYEDRNSMFHSVESRVPFLIPAMVEMAYSIPDDDLINPQDGSKALFKKAMKGFVPDAVLDRKDKIGFQTPEHEWMRSVSDWVHEVLEGAENYSWLKTDILRAEWDDILEKKATYNSKVWRWVNYLQWARIFEVR